MGLTARGGCSPAIVREISCSRRCGARASPTSRPRPVAATGWSSATRGSPRLCAARRRPTGPAQPSAATACRGAVRELALLERVRVILCLGAFAWDAALVLLAGVTGAKPPRPRPRFGHAAELPRRALHAARLLSPEPAEHVYRQAHRADDRRGACARPRARKRPGLARLRAPRAGDQEARLTGLAGVAIGGALLSQPAADR